MKLARRLLALLALAGLALSLTGCKTDDELSSRPWNTPKGWENGLPSSMTEGR